MLHYGVDNHRMQPFLNSGKNFFISFLFTQLICLSCHGFRMGHPVADLAKITLSVLAGYVIR
jgi:hypothetical protein